MVFSFIALNDKLSFVLSINYFSGMLGYQQAHNNRVLTWLIQIHIRYALGVLNLTSSATKERYPPHITPAPNYVNP